VNYLIDTSALVRVLRKQTDPAWDERIGQGLVAVCEPVLMETLTIARAKDYQRMEETLLGTYPWVPVPDRAWDSAREVRRALAAQSAHQGLSVADHLVVATALHHGLTVLHDDADFETVGRILPEFQQERITA
jgi:predicted nucleic acid-binding protein